MTGAEGVDDHPSPRGTLRVLATSALSVPYLVLAHGGQALLKLLQLDWALALWNLAVASLLGAVLLPFVRYPFLRTGAIVLLRAVYGLYLCVVHSSMAALLPRALERLRSATKKHAAALAQHRQKATEAMLVHSHEEGRIRPVSLVYNDNNDTSVRRLALPSETNRERTAAGIDLVGRALLKASHPGRGVEERRQYERVPAATPPVRVEDIEVHEQCCRYIRRRKAPCGRRAIKRDPEMGWLCSRCVQYAIRGDPQPRDDASPT